ncbi:unnamed protein product [Periconia digitata]|uniref:Uncharacterized protein n=1 Tax=Periconia digitata TaxID=1303443 RepID=A0A9W4XX02_9PLEO|nr:unnamed protein product [Periconia digitata]
MPSSSVRSRTSPNTLIIQRGQKYPPKTITSTQFHNTTPTPKPPAPSIADVKIVTYPSSTFPPRQKKTIPQDPTPAQHRRITTL